MLDTFKWKIKSFQNGNMSELFGLGIYNFNHQIPNLVDNLGYVCS